MRIQAYVKKQGFTMQTFAEILKVNRCYLSEIANGLRPSKDMAEKIEVFSKGMIKASALLRGKSKNNQKKQKKYCKRQNIGAPT
jgi:transcriptional regulator with XRE-family HTH domain